VALTIVHFDCTIPRHGRREDVTQNILNLRAHRGEWSSPHSNQPKRRENFLDGDSAPNVNDSVAPKVPVVGEGNFSAC
jgi:hypothetical protein